MSIISELLTDLNNRNKLKGSLSNVIALGENITWSTLVKTLGSAVSYLENSVSLSTAVATPLFLLTQDMIDLSDNIDDVILDISNPLAPVSYVEVGEESVSAIVDLLTTSGGEDESITITDTNGYIYNLMYDGETTSTIDDAECTIIVSDPSDPIIYQDATTLKYFCSTKLHAKSGAYRNVCDVVKDLSASSDISEILLDSVNYFRCLSDASAVDASSYISYIKNKWSDSSSTVDRVINLVVDSFIRGGAYGAIKTIIQIIGSLKDLSEVSTNVLGLVNPLIYMPQAWISGALIGLISSAVSVISGIVTAVQPAIGMALGLLSSGITSLIQAPAYAYENETYCGIDTINLNKQPYFPLSLCDYYIEYEGYETTQALADLISQTGCVQVIEVPGGALYVGFNQSKDKLAVSFHPSLDDCAYGAHLLAGAPAAAPDGSGVAYSVQPQSYTDYQSTCGFTSTLHTNGTNGSISLSQVYTDNGLTITPAMIKAIWEKGKVSNFPFEEDMFKDSGVAYWWTDHMFRINCIFNASLFTMYCLALGSDYQQLIVRPSAGHSVIFCSQNNSSLQWTSLTPIPNLGSGAIGVGQICSNIFEFCILEMQVWQFFLNEYLNNTHEGWSFDQYFIAAVASGGIACCMEKEVTWEKIVNGFSIDFGVKSMDIVGAPANSSPQVEATVWVVGSIQQIRQPQSVWSQVVYVTRNGWWYDAPVSATSLTSCVYLPKYTKRSIISFTVISMTVILVASVVAAITIPKVIKWRRKKQRESQVAIERAWNNCTGTEEGQGPTPENLAAYDKAVRKANFGRLLWGGTKFSRTNYWNSSNPADDVSSSSDESESQTSLTELAQSLQQENTAQYPDNTRDISSAEIITLLDKNYLKRN